MQTEPTIAPDYLRDEHLSRGTREYLEILNSSPVPVESLPVAEARRVLVDAQAAERADLSGIDETSVRIPAGKRTIAVDVVRPAGAMNTLAPFLFLHGGGWVLGDYPTHRRLVRDIVVGSGQTALFVNYTPSPEARFPQAIEEIFAVLEWTAANGGTLGVDGSRIALVGNSAGGNMAVATALKARDAGIPVRCQILLWPVTDAGAYWESYRLYGRERFLTSSLMNWFFEQYLGDGTGRDSIYLSPVRASAEQLRGLPPTLIAVAENDILRDQGEALGRKLDLAGVETATVRFNGVIHDWGMLNGFAGLAATRALVDLAAATLKRY